MRVALLLLCVFVSVVGVVRAFAAQGIDALPTIAYEPAGAAKKDSVGGACTVRGVSHREEEDEKIEERTYSQRQRLKGAVADLLDSSRESIHNMQLPCCFISFVFSLVCKAASSSPNSQLQLPTVKLQTLSRTPYDSGD
ncbi:hypothetical protein OsJ_21094 [Oryza sativa Japonica Group]|uniref:Uncharacterized protein n=1 Tax=Oryza sativa subsp. japonica TaxID=39947 RepID=A3BB19_ORYSJ|nr:hypothetical protein OsJ_21094 [Oryza sativa Japonica Group]